jgi:HSP20 family protein
MSTRLTTWHPFSDLGDLRRRFDRVLEEIDNDGRAWSPSVDLIRDDGHLILKADLPGIAPEEVEIAVADGVLTVSGEHTEEHGEKKERYVRRERRSGSFQRSMTLPEGVEADQIEATCKDGVLEIKIPLPEPQAKAEQKVTIKPKEA